MASASSITRWAAVLILSGVFIYAGVLKMLRPDLLLVDIQSYNLVPYRIAYLGALFLPPLEIVAGLGLLTGTLRKESTSILLLLMLVFIAALISAWSRGLDISCGCFGKSETDANYPLLIARDLVLIAGLSAILFLERRKKGVQ